MATTPDDLRNRADEFRSQLPAPREPPQETGWRIAVIERSADEAIHINWCEFHGKPYIGVRLWTRGRDGQYWPDSRRGMSIRLRELPEMAEALAVAMDWAEEYQRRWRAGQAARGEAAAGPDERSHGPDRGRDGGAPEGFSEFDG